MKNKTLKLFGATALAGAVATFVYAGDRTCADFAGCAGGCFMNYWSATAGAYSTWQGCTTGCPDDQYQADCTFDCNTNYDAAIQSANDELNSCLATPIE